VEKRHKFHGFLGFLQKKPLFELALFETFFNLATELFHRVNTKELRKMKRFEELKSMLTSMEEDFTKFYDKGNQAAGTRVRKGMQELKNLAQEIRTEVQDIKNAEK